jgi:hypothetical protein
MAIQGPSEGPHGIAKRRSVLRVLCLRAVAPGTRRLFVVDLSPCVGRPAGLKVHRGVCHMGPPLRCRGDSLRNGRTAQGGVAGGLTMNVHKLKAVGVTLAPDRLRPEILGKFRPRDRSEEEVAGYREALDWSFSRKRPVRIDSALILHLHSLAQGGASGDAGQWKNRSNEIVVILSSGQRGVCFKATSAKETPAAIKSLCEHYRDVIEAGRVPPLSAHTQRLATSQHVRPHVATSPLTVGGENRGCPSHPASTFRAVPPSAEQLNIAHRAMVQCLMVCIVFAVPLHQQGHDRQDACDGGAGKERILGFLSLVICLFLRESTDEQQRVCEKGGNCDQPQHELLDTTAHGTPPLIDASSKDQHSARQERAQVLFLGISVGSALGRG